LNPGELNRRISLHQQTKEPDGQGGFQTTYVQKAIIWAKITTRTATMKDQYEAMVPEIVQQIIIRYRRDIVVTDRLEYKNRIFEQIGPPVDEGEKKAYLRLTCREVVIDADSDSGYGY